MSKKFPRFQKYQTLGCGTPSKQRVIKKIFFVSSLRSKSDLMRSQVFLISKQVKFQKTFVVNTKSTFGKTDRHFIVRYYEKIQMNEKQSAILRCVCLVKLGE